MGGDNEIGGWMDGCMETMGLVTGWMDGWTDGWMDVGMIFRRTDG